jgi:hypothetical protein
MSQRARSFLVVLLTLVLVTGAVVQSAQATDMTARMSTVADTGMPHDCSGCADEDHGLPTACFAVCGNIAVAVLPSVPAVAVEGFPSPATNPTLLILGEYGPPEPYPPRSTSLS